MKHSWRKCLVVFLVLSLTLGACSAKSGKAPVDLNDYQWKENGDLETIRTRILEDTYDKTADDAKFKLLKADGSFETIDYNSQLKDEWHPLRHLKYLLEMQKAVYSPGNPNYMREDMRDGVRRAVEYWVKNNYTCSWNGWYAGIGEPLVLSEVLLFPHDNIADGVYKALQKRATDHGLDAEKKEKNIRQRAVSSVGGNLTDKAINDLKVAAATGNGSMVLWLTTLMENELRIFPEKKWFANRWDVEGIKADMGFLQHFELLYSGGYGDVFVHDMNQYIGYTEGTQFALKGEAVNFYAAFILDGMQYITRNGYRDINASGRGIVRKDELKNSVFGNVRSAAKLLAGIDRVERKEELNRLLTTRQLQKDNGAGGFGCFYKCDYSVYNDASYMASVRAASKRTKNSEALNGENVLGHYLGAGATMLYLDGGEYENVLPLWNWNRIPGTTSVQGYLPVGGDETYAKMGKTGFAGGASTGKIGLHCLDYKDNKVKAKKAWFFFEEGMVSLGANIASSDSREVYTNINQSLLRDTVAYAHGDTVKQARGGDIAIDGNWAYHNHMGYISRGNPMLLRAGERTGDWNTISTRQNSSPHKDSVFEIGISHGASPKSAAYDYTVLMNTDAEKTAAYARNPTILTLRNDKDVQAVWNTATQTLQAVFWKPTAIKLPNGTVVEADRPCALVYEKTAQGGKVYASNPRQGKLTLTVQVNGKEAVFDFQKGNEGGKTVLCTF